MNISAEAQTNMLRQESRSNYNSSGSDNLTRSRTEAEEDADWERLFVQPTISLIRADSSEGELDSAGDLYNLTSGRRRRRRRARPEPGKINKQGWSSWFSEENTGWSEYAGRGINGYRCSSGKCDNNGVHFGALLTKPPKKWSHWFSEEGGGHAICGANQVMVAAQCGGGRCDNKRIACEAVASGVFTGPVTESGWFSEENGGTKVCANAGYIFAMYCGGGSCDNTNFKCGKWYPPVDCKWGAWGAWVKCSKACGKGTQSRKRGQTAAKYHGKACTGKDTESRDCNTQSCATACVMNPWSAWKACSHTCNGGRQLRVRTVKAQPTHGGTACPKDLSQSQSCSNSLCPTTTTTTTPT
eukprot:CAMPEP_0197654846 /NCGR_PEP_ID=MMETSP1338-20131121/39092_1 /TAXON_ID=43686 ORGANISM="Pelagodinium beii, Strain RCC1491" /NCGR_SAMPLE_ID=MMETSP1338 /ASSEMBLY_ACC=CAM_ASM_000754 /LENGTH=355 /DNA_ID=CAMNT_0043230367 /DNA_START=138 /DNA_END=1201 /DNA_ORIENTATION=+